MEDLGEYQLIGPKNKAVFTNADGEPEIITHNINPAANIEED
jgi:hypothetical protein